MKKNEYTAPNRTTLKPKERKAGTFTATPNYFLKKSNMSIYANMLMIQLLSDSDSFTLSATGYAKRMNISRSQVYKAIDELVENGFISKTPFPEEVAVKYRKKQDSDKVIYHYTICEFGTLNKRKEEAEKEQKQIIKAPVAPSGEVLQQLAELTRKDYFTRTAIELIDWNGVEGFSDDFTQFEQLITRIGNKIPHVQKSYADEVKNSLRNYHSNQYPNSIKKKMDERIKQVVYTEQRIFNSPSIGGSLDEAQNYWSRITNEYNKKQSNKKLDYETLLHDQLEEAYYDGDY